MFLLSLHENLGTFQRKHNELPTTRMCFLKEEVRGKKKTPQVEGSSKEGEQELAQLSALVWQLTDLQISFLG